MDAPWLPELTLEMRPERYKQGMISRYDRDMDGVRGDISCFGSELATGFHRRRFMTGQKQG